MATDKGIRLQFVSESQAERHKGTQQKRKRKLFSFRLSENLGKSRILIFVLLFIVLASGCVGQSSEVKEGLSITLTADPNDIHYTEATTLFIDMENKGETDFAMITYDLFDTGILASLREGCYGEELGISPGEIVSRECILALKDGINLVQPVTETTVRFRAVTDNSLKTTAVLQMLSQDEWRRRLTAGTLETGSGSFASRDNNMQVSVDFSKNMPFAESAAGETVLFMIKIRNIGNGFIEQIEPEQFSIEQRSNLVACDFEKKIVPFNGVFPPIFCTLTVSAGGAAFANYPVTFSINYNYEVRESVDVTVRR